MNKLKKGIAIVLLMILVLFGRTPAWAIEMPTPPPAPSTPVAPSAPTQPSAPPSTPTPTQTPTYQPSVQPTASPTSQPVSQPSPTVQPTQSSSNQSNESSTNSSPSPSPFASATPTPTPTTNQTGNNQQVGDTFLKTGDANNTGNIVTSANNNQSVLPNTATTSPAPNSNTVSNEGNGANSQSNTNLTNSNNKTTNQDNQSHVLNNLHQSSITGRNSAVDNVGDTTLATGDANVTGTVISQLNTNIDGLAVSEFNIADNYQGDYILDFAKHCIIGCQNFSNTQVANTNNGANSQNNANLSTLTNQNTFQQNDAQAESNLILTADSGNNDASRNTGGDTFINTGDANVAANALSLVNNNLSGQVLYGVVNVFGKLVGDIIIPKEVLQGLGVCGDCTNDVNLMNSGNGSNSQNTAEANLSTNEDLFQTNEADIQNNIIVSGTTGDNQTSLNTDGVSYVSTGDTNVDAKALNIANSNMNGGNWWLVLVNQAGQWIGKIMGAPEGNQFAGSDGTQFAVNGNGDITAINNGNGSGSSNEASVNQTTDTNIQQNNTAKVTNNLQLTANTGQNKASGNTGGDSVVKTGDSNVVASLVNFVNNNITGGGKLLVTVVNVFGEWAGNLFTPDQEKKDHTTNQNQPMPTDAPVPSQGSTADSSTTKTPSNQVEIYEEYNVDPVVETNIVYKTVPTQAVIPTKSPQSSPVFRIVKNTHFPLPQQQSPAKVAGFKAEVDSFGGIFDSNLLEQQSLDKKILRVNLAWFILALPLLFLTIPLVNIFKRWIQSTKKG